MIAPFSGGQLRAKRHRRLLAPLLAGILVRLALMLIAYHNTGTQIMTQGDTASYIEPGIDLFLQASYTNNGLPELDRTPGYPVVAMLTGMLSGNVLLTVLAQIGVSCLSMLLVSRIAEDILPAHGAGSMAAWLYAIEPLGVTYAIRILPETIFTALLLAVIERILVFLRTGKLLALAMAGVLLAAATYVRPVGYYLVLPLAAGLFLTAGKRSLLRWKAPTILLVVAVPLIGVWQLRNFVETGYSGFSSIVEKNLYFFQSAAVSAKLRHIPLEQQQRELGYPDDQHYLAVHPEQRDWSQATRLRFMKSESMRVISHNPALYAKTHMAGVAVVAFSPGSSELLQLIGLYPDTSGMPHRILDEGILASIRTATANHPGVVVSMSLAGSFLLLLYAGAVRGFLRGWRSSGRDRVMVILLAGVVFYFLLISGGAQAVARYRLPVMPILCSLAAAGYSKARILKTESGPGCSIAES